MVEGHCFARAVSSAYLVEAETGRTSFGVLSSGLEEGFPPRQEPISATIHSQPVYSRGKFGTAAISQQRAYARCSVNLQSQRSIFGVTTVYTVYRYSNSQHGRRFPRSN